MPRPVRSRKKYRKRIKREQRSPRIESPDMHGENPDEQRSHNNQHSINMESLDSIRATLFSLQNSILNKNRTTPIEKQEFCYRMGNLYSNMLELAFELGTIEEETEMEWQHEPTCVVHLVRTSEEMACYPDGAVVGPWQTASNSSFPSALGDSSIEEPYGFIDDIL